MKNVFMTVAALLSSAWIAQAQSSISGDWQGSLKVGTIELRLVLHIVATGDGFKATLDSVDQASTIPISSISLKASKLVFAADTIQGSYEGTVSSNGATIDGMWSQGGRSLPLLFSLVKDAAQLELRRPQNPVKPYPYREEEVEYANKAAGITLAATLTVPSGRGPFPAVLLITGSGPQDRDESLMGHRPFLVLADYLTRKGIAVLRADDRGFGKSGGNFASATTADFATDAEAGVAYLRSRAEVNARKIGLVGHSEGGVIAPMVAARSSVVAFIVLMAGSGVPGDQIIVAQSVLIAQANGARRDVAERNADDLRELLALVKEEQNSTVLDTKLRERLTGRFPPDQVEAQIKALTAPWYRYFIGYDPAATLAHVTCPVLAIGGEKDLQVPPEENLNAIRAALKAAGNKDVEIDELSDLNHLFQTAKTGSPSEYGQIEETMSPAALEKIARWISKQ